MQTNELDTLCNVLLILFICDLQMFTSTLAQKQNAKETQNIYIFVDGMLLIQTG